MPIVTQVANVLLIATIISSSVTVMINMFKPVVFDALLEEYGYRIYLGAILITRALFATGIVALSGGASLVYDQAPALTNIPAVSIVLLLILIVSGGSSILHRISDLLDSFYGRVKPDLRTDVESLANLASITSRIDPDNTMLSDAGYSQSDTGTGTSTGTVSGSGGTNSGTNDGEENGTNG